MARSTKRPKKRYAQPKKRKKYNLNKAQKLAIRGRYAIPGATGTGSTANRRFSHSKTCSECGEEKTLDYFNENRKARGLRGGYLKAGDPRRYVAKCRECIRAPSAAEVDPNFKPDRAPRVFKKKRGGEPLYTPEKKRAIAATYKRKVRTASRIKALQYMADKGCETCEERDPRVLEFDHLDPTKKSIAISELLSNGYSWGAERLRIEIRKCRVLCVRCHRLHTHQQMEYYAHDDTQSALREIYRRYGIEE